MTRISLTRTYLTALTFFVLLLLALSAAAPAQAGGTVTNCSNDTDFSNQLVGGGTITFNCGTATILWSSTKTIAANTTIDGGGNITLSGGFGHRLFVVNPNVTLTLQNITLINGYNPDPAGGAGVSNNGHLILTDVTVHSMVDSAFDGGGISTIGALDITNSTFYENKATNGGAIFGSGAGAVITIDSSTLYDNHATGKGNNGFGGAIYLASGAQLHLDSTSSYSGTARFGGAIYVATGASATITRSPLYNNSASSDGGAIFNKGATDVSNNTISGNSASYGGGIDNDHGSLTMIDSTLTLNVATVAGGGGIANDHGTMTLTNLTVSENFASGDAGGIENGRGTATITNVTLSGNRASSGGGMWNLYGGTAYLTNVTFKGNAGSSNGGGIGNTNDVDTHLYLTNVIIADSDTGDNCAFDKAPDLSDHNLSSDASCNFAAGGGHDSVKMKLGPLETNGGMTLTHRLLPGSPAIDGGVFVANILTDQRSTTRPRGGAFDVGAVESVPCTGVPTKPQIWFPASGAQFTEQKVTLDWIGPDCVKSYSIVVRQGSKTGPIAFSKSKIKPTQATTTGLPRHSNYFWQVTACRTAGCATSVWSKFKVK